MINLDKNGDINHGALDFFVNLPDSSAWYVWPSGTIDKIKNYFRKSNGEVNMQRLDEYLKEHPIGTLGASTINAIQEFLGL